jgi:dihydroorotate dehydrogenase electron transfer subunit
MLWIPGVGEVPMSVSVMGDDGVCGFTVRSVGPTSEALCGLRSGDRIGLRGPYGNGFTPIYGSALLVGGGTGASPLLPLARILLAGGSKLTFLLAGKTHAEILFIKEVERMFRGLNHRLMVATDDGSYGFCGLASDCAAGLLEQNTYDIVYTCGPEAMMRKIFDLADAKGVLVQASLERYMKCGFGLCGSCAVGPYLVCVDGPVFDSKRIREVLSEFGVSKRDTSGTLISV